MERRGIWWRIGCCAAILSPLTVALYTLHLTPVAVSSAAEVIVLLPAQVWILSVLLRKAAERNVDAKLLLLPVLLTFGYKLVEGLPEAAYRIGLLRQRPSISLRILQYPYPVSLQATVFTIFAFAMMLFLIRRFSLARREEERLVGELEAARSIQSLMLPASHASTPGFRLESVYVPASEVGGDFFQIFPADDGSLLVVVGDVSGKGLKAAMTVSAIVGALRGCTMRVPAQVLAYLNRAMHGQVTGFFTCCAALISADGKLTIANAGHLSPYLNGEELAVDSGLPLGIADGTVYAEKIWQLNPDDRLTFVSDGVVEARDASGELYGFTRTRDISGQSAETIAHAAQVFGQEDDITVLSVTRTATLGAVPA